VYCMAFTVNSIEVKEGHVHLTISLVILNNLCSKILP
jgi:hypothetical protein